MLFLMSKICNGTKLSAKSVSNKIQFGANIGGLFYYTERHTVKSVYLLSVMGTNTGERLQTVVSSLFYKNKLD